MPTPHCHRQPRHFVFAAKNRALSRIVSLASVFSRVRSAQRRPRFIERNVPVAADAQNLQINAAGIVNSLLVLPAMGLEIERPPIGTFVEVSGMLIWSTGYPA